MKLARFYFVLGLIFCIFSCKDGLYILIDVADKCRLNDSADLYFVSKSGNDANADGSANLPFLTIAAAMNHAEQHSSNAKIIIGAGSYQVEYQAATHITLKPGISLYGGYNSSCWSQRDLNVYATSIQDISSGGGASQTTANRAIDCGIGLTSSVIVDGLNIIAGGGDYATAVFCDGSGPTIQNNTISGGNSSMYSMGIFSRNSSPVQIKNNIISGGTPLNNSDGIVLNTNNGAVIGYNVISGGKSCLATGITSTTSSNSHIHHNTIIGNEKPGNGGCQGHGMEITTGSNNLIENNIISAGTAYSHVRGIALNNTAPIIRNNLINGGYTTAVGQRAAGIAIQNGSPKIHNNIINGGSGGASTSGIYNSATSFNGSPEIINNIIFTSGGTLRYGIHNEGDADTDAIPSLVQNNNIFNVPDALYLRYITGSDCGTNDCISNITGVNSLPSTTASGNVSALPVFVNENGADNLFYTQSDNDWHFTIGSSMCSVTQGGFDLSGQFNSSLDDNSRTVPFSIGAYESDQPCI